MTELSRSELKDIAKRIVLNQGNKYIKELLRQNKVKIGKNKDEFLKNLLDGIDEGKIDQEKIDKWLESVEGWGNQHVYLFQPPSLTFEEAKETIEASDMQEVLAAQENYEFPEELSLMTAKLNPQELSLGWREGRDSWVRAKVRDFREEVDGEEYEYRAYREKSERKLVRFVWQFGKPYCGVFISQANDRGVHLEIFGQVWDDLRALGICSSALSKIALTEAFEKLNTRRELKVNSVRLSVDGGHVNLVATAPQTGIHDVEAIRQAQIGLDVDQFSTSDGIFHFNADNLSGLSREVKVEGSGIDSRVRIWAQCTRDDVEKIIDEIDHSR